jgi:hypothetical protein
MALVAAQSPVSSEVVVNVVMKLDGDATASDIGWALTADDGEFQTAVPFGGYSPSSEIVDQIVVPGGGDYVFTIKDDSGNGLGPNGSYELSLDETFDNFVLTSGSGNFTDEESSSFYIPSFPYEVSTNETEEDDFVTEGDDIVFPPPPPTKVPTSPSSAPGGGGPGASTIPPDSAMGARISQLLVGSMVAAAAFLL